VKPSIVLFLYASRKYIKLAAVELRALACHCLPGHPARHPSPALTRTPCLVEGGRAELAAWYDGNRDDERSTPAGAPAGAGQGRGRNLGGRPQRLRLGTGGLGREAKTHRADPAPSLGCETTTSP